MTFKFTVARPPFAVEFETGSIGEGIGVLQAEGTEFAKLFDITFGGGADTADEAAPAAGEPAKRGRKPRNGADPATATAPPPAPIPAAPAAPAADGGIPAFLQRAPETVSPPPLLPAAPPTAPTPPQPGPLGAKVIAYVKEKTAGAADGGQSYADWLAGAGLTIKGAKLPEALEAMTMMADDKFAGVAQALGIAA